MDKPVSLNAPGLLHLVGQVYEASYNPAHWVEVLRLVALATGSKSASLMYRDLDYEQASFAFGHGVETEAAIAYTQHFYKIDPFYELSVQTVPVGVASADHLMIPDRQALEAHCGDFFTGYMQKYDHYHIGGAHLFREAGRAGAIAIQRGRAQGPWSNAELQVLTDLAPHFQRAFRIHREFTRLRVQESAVHAMLDQLVMGLVLLDVKGRVTYRNPVADSIIEAHPALRLRNEMLVISDKASADNYARLVAEAAKAQAGPDAGGMLGVRHAGRRFPLPLLITPLNHLELFSAMSLQTAAVAVFMTDPEHGQSIAPDLLSETYGLTPAEASVAVALANGMSIKEVAQAYGTSPNTVRSQLKAIFRKTGVSRQVDLVRLFLTGPFRLSL
jgi:DNA-binding CsgD family transcriptional regulator